MEGYEREWVTSNGFPGGSRLRVGLSTRRGTPVQFLVQLEYRVEGTWLVVSRFEHESDGPPYRDVEWAGLHLDIHHPDGSQVSKITGWSPTPASQAMETAEEYLRNDAQRLIERFERWR